MNDPAPAPRLAVDASVVVTLLLDPGPAGDAVAARLRECDLHAPELMCFEAANVIRRRWSAGLVTLGAAERALDGLRALPVSLWPYEPIASLMWTRRGALSAYDAAYVAVADLLDCPLLTADAKLAAAPGLDIALELAQNPAP